MAACMKRVIFLCVLLHFVGSRCNATKYTESDIRGFRDRVVKMFHHAYDGYIKYAYPYDELRPLTCDGLDTWGSYSLTLIDALDTLAVMGNYTEFQRVAQLVIEKMDFDIDINASVFETNIRILGGLLSAHLFTHKAGMDVEPGWPCSGPLLRLAEEIARKLLPAFDTATGMPYGTVNLKHGVPKGETTVTCTAGAGTFLVEFGTLSRLTGDPVFEKVAMRAMRALWKFRSEINLVGNHIDVNTGKWTAVDAGIGGGIDSYFEYLVKGGIMFQIPELLEMFHEYAKAAEVHLKRDDWYMWANMKKGGITLPMFTSLDAFWPGIQSMLGDIDSAMKTMHNFHQVWRQFGFLPEYYNIPKAEIHGGREGYPLRPELIESAVYLYQATKDPFLLDVGVDMLESIEHSTKTDCGYATVKNVATHELENRMESFFLAETTKYLYLLFDTDNFIHNNGSSATVINTPNGECVIDAGGYFFTTEAHPIDVACVHCCSAQKKEEDEIIQNMHDNLDLLSMLKITEPSGTVRGTKWHDLKDEMKRARRKADSKSAKHCNSEDCTSEKDTTKENLHNKYTQDMNVEVKVDSSGEISKGDNSDLTVNKEEKQEDLKTENIDPSANRNDEDRVLLDETLQKLKNLASDMRDRVEQDKNSKSLKPSSVVKEKSDTEKHSIGRSDTSSKNDKQSTGESKSLSTNDQLYTGESESLSTNDQLYTGQSESLSTDDQLYTGQSESLSTDDQLYTGQSESFSINNKQSTGQSDTSSNVDQQSTGQSDTSSETSQIIHNINKDDVAVTSSSSLNTKSTERKDNVQVLKQNLQNTLSGTTKSTVNPTETKKSVANLDKLFQFLYSKFDLKDPKDQVPNVYNLYRQMQYYPNSYKQQPELLVCNAQPFHMRMSAMGEMFEKDKQAG